MVLTAPSSAALRFILFTAMEDLVFYIFVLASASFISLFFGCCLLAALDEEVHFQSGQQPKKIPHTGDGP